MEYKVRRLYSSSTILITKFTGYGSQEYIHIKVNYIPMIISLLSEYIVRDEKKVIEFNENELLLKELSRL